MLIYTHSITNRCRFGIGLVFETLLNQAYTLTDDLEQYHAHEGEKLAYTFQRPQNGFFVQAVSLLFETGIRTVEPGVFSFSTTKAFFATQGDFPFDLFAAGFYLVSRYEEYGSFRPDLYGRFPAEESLASRHGFLQTPVVNVWAEEFKKALSRFYPALSFPTPVFQSITSFDVDVAYAFAGRSWLYHAAVFSKLMLTGSTKEIGRRWRVIRGREADPYDTYPGIQKLFTEYKTGPLFFFLLPGHRTRFDRNLPPSSGLLQRLIKITGSFSDLGIHPSYYSMNKPALLQREKAALEKITGRPVTKSRQHYLRFRLPGTYRNLLEAGITDDYSMGYAGLPGFRAGICTPFYFYDLGREQGTALKIHPVIYMDGSFIEDMGLQPAAALAVIRDLIRTVKSVNGTCLSIWHNHTVSDEGIYKGWKGVLEESLRFMHSV